MNPPLHYAVIGAGIAGLSCARALAEAGVHVTVFDKSRGPGGRMSTRRGEGWACDHGAQYFTTRAPLFQAELARWQAAGVAARWQPRLAVFDADGRRAAGGAGGDAGGDELARHVGTPRMTAPARLLAEGLDLRLQTTVTALQRYDHGWELATAERGLLPGASTACSSPCRRRRRCRCCSPCIGPHHPPLRRWRPRRGCRRAGR